MDSSLISKVEKAIRYAQERNRIHFAKFNVSFQGDNGDHEVSYQDGSWNCNCDYFGVHLVCSHTMAMERVLSGMIVAAKPPSPSASQSPNLTRALS